VSCPVQTKKSTGHATEHISYPALSFNLWHLWFWDMRNACAGVMPAAKRHQSRHWTVL
jgi:hypothetical protein